MLLGFLFLFSVEGLSQLPSKPRSIQPENPLAPKQDGPIFVQVQQTTRAVTGTIRLGPAGTPFSIVSTMGPTQYWNQNNFTAYVAKTCPTSCSVFNLTPLVASGITPCSVCNSTSFQSTDCTATSDRVCTPCATRQINEYVRSSCTPTTNTVFANCTICAAGTYESSPCTETADRVCSPCSARGPDQFMVTPCQNYSTTVKSGSGSDATFLNCTQCVPGVSYQSSPCGAIDSVTQKEVDRVCTACSTCPTGMYRNATCTNTTNTVCMSCTVCGSGQSETSPCTNTSNRVCSQTSSRGWGVAARDQTCSGTPIRSVQNTAWEDCVESASRQCESRIAWDITTRTCYFFTQSECQNLKPANNYLLLRFLGPKPGFGISLRNWTRTTTMSLRSLEIMTFNFTTETSNCLNSTVTGGYGWWNRIIWGRVGERPTGSKSVPANSNTQVISVSNNELNFPVDTQQVWFRIQQYTVPGGTSSDSSTWAFGDESLTCNVATSASRGDCPVA